jgi:hypothetical protein
MKYVVVGLMLMMYVVVGLMLMMCVDVGLMLMRVVENPCQNIHEFFFFGSQNTRKQMRTNSQNNRKHVLKTQN